MITNNPAFRKLIEMFRALPLEEPIGDLLQIFAWQHLEKNNTQEGLPKLSDVIDGKTTLEMAFHQIDKFLGKRYLTFGLTTFWKKISPIDSRIICQTVSELADIDKFDLVKTCLQLKYEIGFHKEIFLFENELLELLLDLASADSGKIFVPYDRNLQLAILYAERGLKVFYSHAKVEAFTEAADIILGLCNENWEAKYNFEHMFSDAPLVESNQKYSKIVLIPPFGAKVEVERKKINSEVVLIENALAKCTGSLIALVPQGMMFRGGESSELRRDLVTRNLLKAVIQLPSSMLRYSSIALSILVIQKDSLAGKVRFIDADRGKFFSRAGRGNLVKVPNTKELVDVALHKSDVKNDYCADVDFEEISVNHFDLSVSKYVLGRASKEIEKFTKVMRLEELATLVRGQLLKEVEEVMLPVQEYFEVGVRDIGEDGYVSKPAKSILLAEGMVNQAEKQKLLPGDILLVSKGSVGKVSLVGMDCGENWVASQSFQIIRLKNTPKVTYPEYLYMFLSSKLMQEFFKEHVTGTTIPVLKTNDIKTLAVPIPSLDKQAEVVSKHNSIMANWKSIKTLKAEITELQNTCWGLD